MTSNSETPAPVRSCVDSLGVHLEEVFLNASSLSPNALYLNLYATLSDSLASGIDTSLRTLIDSGSSHCFISSEIVMKNAWPTSEIRPIRLRYLDGSSSIIKKQITLLIRFPSGEVHSMDFYVTRLDSPSELVLGYNWLHRFNPLIDWSAASISFRSTPLGPSVSTPQDTSPASVLPDSELLNNSEPTPTTGLPAFGVAPETPTMSLPDPGPSMDSSSGFTSPPISTPLVSLVSAAAYSMIIGQAGTVQYTLRATPKAEDVRARSSTLASDQSDLPSEYHDFADVFSESEAFNLPPNRH